MNVLGVIKAPLVELNCYQEKVYPRRFEAYYFESYGLLDNSRLLGLNLIISFKICLCFSLSVKIVFFNLT